MKGLKWERKVPYVHGARLVLIRTRGIWWLVGFGTHMTQIILRVIVRHDTFMSVGRGSIRDT